MVHHVGSATISTPRSWLIQNKTIRIKNKKPISGNYPRWVLYSENWNFIFGFILHFLWLDSILAKESFHLPNIDMDQIPQTLDFFQEKFSGIDNKKTHEPKERGLTLQHRQRSVDLIFGRMINKRIISKKSITNWVYQKSKTWGSKRLPGWAIR